MQKILLVEDNETITKGLKYSLEQEKFEVEMGADDYIIKPFITRELISRIKSVLRRYYHEEINGVISNIIGEITQAYPDVDNEEILKILNGNSSSEKGEEILKKFGIDVNKVQAINELQNQKQEMIINSIISNAIFAVLIIVIILMYQNKQNRKIESIINYIEEINKGNYNLNIEKNTENELSNLSNELYKITVMLKEQAETSDKDKNVLQTSLEDISHQLKTPLTSISIMLDNIRENPQMDDNTIQEFIHEISRQVEWINWLVISLLKLSKLDSGTAIFKTQEIYG